MTWNRILKWNLTEAKRGRTNEFERWCESSYIKKRNQDAEHNCKLYLLQIAICIICVGVICDADGYTYNITKGDGRSGGTSIRAGPLHLHSYSWWRSVSQGHSLGAEPLAGIPIGNFSLRAAIARSVTFTKKYLKKK